MSSTVRNVAILGSTGSIGQSTLEVIAASQGRLKVVGLAANSSLDLLCSQAKQTNPLWIAVTDSKLAEAYDWSGLPQGVQLFTGVEGVEKIASATEVDVVVAAIVGSAGLNGAWAALEAGKTLALANKETLVMAGPLAIKLAAERNAIILPIDSEHSAIFQALRSGEHREVQRIILTASGGPFLRHSAEQMLEVTVQEALAHPTWEMGPKITIDSATMMNKALEVIEARWLFDLPPEKIEVVVHPQSIVHSMVEFCDGSIIAQLSPPDMKLPIQYALTYPQRWESPAAKLDFTQPRQFEFQPPDLERFPALSLGFEVAQMGGTAGAVLNAANEAAVAEFLDGRLSFTEIVSACRTVLENHEFDPNPTLDQLMKLDAWARQETTRWVCT